MKSILATLCLVLISLPLYANKSYTAKQLHSFVNKNKYPKVGESQTMTKDTDFDSCKKVVNTTKNQIGSKNPVRIIADSGLVYMVKIWSDDSEILLNCSKPDSKLTIVTSPYL